MKIVFAGTADFGIPTLEILNTKYLIPLIITQPDQPTGRRKVLTPPPVKIWAEKNNIPVLQPKKILDSRLQIQDSNPDLLLVAAYGQIIPADLLGISKYGSINIHASLLPKYRGATPIQTAILNGEEKTGITLIQMDEKMDHGPILASAQLEIEPADDYFALSKKLSVLAASLIEEFLPKLLAGQVRPALQNHDLATYTKIYKFEDGRLDWTKPAWEILNKIRALSLEPGVWSKFAGKSVKIMEAKLLKDSLVDLPGKVYGSNGLMAVKCQDYSLIIEKLQPEGKKQMQGRDFLNGLKKEQDKIFI